MIRLKENGRILFKNKTKDIAMKDMRVGLIQYDLSTLFESPLFHLKTNEFSENFLFAVQPGNRDDLVLVENEVKGNHSS